MDKLTPCWLTHIKTYVKRINRLIPALSIFYKPVCDTDFPRVRRSIGAQVLHRSCGITTLSRALLYNAVECGSDGRLNVGSIYGSG